MPWLILDILTSSTQMQFSAIFTGPDLETRRRYRTGFNFVDYLKMLLYDAQKPGTGSVANGMWEEKAVTLSQSCPGFRIRVVGHESSHSTSLCWSGLWHCIHVKGRSIGTVAVKCGKNLGLLCKAVPSKNMFLAGRCWKYSLIIWRYDNGRLVVQKLLNKY